MEPIGDPRVAYAKGRLKFRLHGEKLRGGWTLVRMRSRDQRRAQGRSWLLVKERDEAARPAREHDITAARPESVLSGRDLEQIARERDRVWGSRDPAKIPGARRAPLPRFVQPQLATLVDRAPAGADWLHEIKFDGYRVESRIAAGEVTLLSRNAKDWTGAFPSVAGAAPRLPCRAALLDGEVAVVLDDGTTRFNALHNAMGWGRAT